MPGSRSRSHRLLAAAAALAVVAAACGGGNGDAKGSAGTKSRTTSTTQADGKDGGGTDGNAGGGAGGSGSTAGAMSSASTVPLERNGLKPNKYGAPLPGSYRYDVTGAELPVELSVRDSLGAQDADHFDRTGDLSQVHYEKERSEARASLVTWSAAGLFLAIEQRAENTTQGLQEGAVCDYEPDLQLQPLHLPVGATWQGTSTCTAKQGDVTINRERTLRGEVLASSSAQVEGHLVPTVRLKRVTDTKTTADTSPPLVTTEHRELTIEWIVSAGLAARIEGIVISTVSGAPQKPQTFTWVLRSTKPGG